MENKNVDKLRFNGRLRYPRGRPVAVYVTPDPRPSIQSLWAEHPKELNRPDGGPRELQTAPRVIPSPDPDLQEYRSSYFS